MQQQVMCNGHKSKLKFINYGVPQGSNLGPLLFLLYVNDLPKLSSLLHFILFADDTNVFYSHRSLDLLMNLLNSELAAIANWFRTNKLSLNVSKTNFIVSTLIGNLYPIKGLLFLLIIKLFFKSNLPNFLVSMLMNTLHGRTT